MAQSELDLYHLRGVDELLFSQEIDRRAAAGESHVDVCRLRLDLCAGKRGGALKKTHLYLRGSK